MRHKTDIPEANKAFIGGASTFVISFPEDRNLSGIKVLQQKTAQTLRPAFCLKES
jgi:hypothetical protein